MSLRTLKNDTLFYFCKINFIMKNYILLFTFILYLATSLYAFSNDKVTNNCKEDDYIALRALYLSTNGDSWTNKTNWLTAAQFMANPTMPAGTDVDSWYGITTNIDGCVTCIALDKYDSCALGAWGEANNLTGTLPPELGNMTELEHLILYSNNLTGSIPPELGNLSNLRRIELHNNQLTGSIPPELGNLSSLNYLELQYNELTGSIPSEIGNLSNLIHFEAQYNQLTGSIPTEFGNLTKLEVLNLTDNQLTGNIPPELGNLSELEKLLLSFNQLTGTIPPELGNLSDLLYLYLSSNQLTGSIPPELGNLSQLNYLRINNNQLSGCFDDNLNNWCTPFYYAGYYGDGGITPGNNFDARWEFFCLFGSGSCTVKVCEPEKDYTALRALYLNTDGDNWTNNTGWLTAAQFMANPTAPAGTNMNAWHGVTVGSEGCVTELRLGNNKLSGEIPKDIGNLIGLTILELSDNALTGKIPWEIKDLINLKSLLLNSNQLNNTIPTGIAALSELETLNLSDNQLDWFLPQHIDHLEKLTYIDAGNNQLDGIWWDFWNIPNLEYLDVSSNQIDGSIPSSIGQLTTLTDLNLSNNQFTGDLPPELADMTALDNLFLNDNQLNGCYDSMLVSLCTQLETAAITEGNNFDATWEDFCATDAGICVFEGYCWERDYQALRALYLNTDGDNWNTRTDWFTAAEFMANPTMPVGTDVSTWYGVTTDSDRCVTELKLGGNQLSGTIPPEIGNLTKLTHLSLSANQLTGSIPSEIGNLETLTIFRVHINELSGNIPSELSNLTNLADLDLDFNQLTGNIPPELGNLINLTDLDLGNNQLTGSIPPEFGNLTNLTSLNISSNNLSGCYHVALVPLCQTTNQNVNISDGNNFDATWSDFCATGAGACTVDIDNTQQTVFKVYPVPASDFIIFDVPNVAIATEIILYDITGRQISRQAFPQDKALSVKHLNDGVYIYRLFYDNDVYSGKIVVE